MNHKEELETVLEKLLGSNRTSVITGEKYTRIVNFLQNPSEEKDANFKFWCKQRQFSLKNLSGIGLHNVVVCPAPKRSKASTLMSSSNYVHVVTTENLYEIVKQIHDNETKHGGYKKVLEHAEQHYFGVTRGYVQAFCKTCPTCQLKAGQKTRPPLRPIIETELLARVQVDLIDMRNCPDGDYHYICHFMDHFSKYHIIFPLKDKHADEVAFKLQERVLAYLGPPKIFHTDNGREFVNAAMSSLMREWSSDVTFVQGRPRHSQSQGLVERGNRTIEAKLAAIKHDQGLQEGDMFRWSFYLPGIMFAMNTQTSETTKQSPYNVVFGQSPQVPVVPGMGSMLIDEDQLDEVDNTGTVPAPTTSTFPIVNEENERPVPAPRRSINRTTPQNRATADYRPVPAPRKSKPDPRKNTESSGSRPIPTPRARNFLPTNEHGSDVSGPTGNGVSAHSPSPPESTNVSGNETQENIVIDLGQENCYMDEYPEDLPDIISQEMSSSRADAACDTSNTPNTVGDSGSPINNAREQCRKRARENTERSAERMSTQYNKAKRVRIDGYNEGDMVSISIPKNERTSTDLKRLPAVVRRVTGDKVPMYELATEYGVLESKFRAGDLEPYNGTVNPVTNKFLSLRGAARQFNHTNNFTKKSCKCSGDCKTNKCACVQNKIDCSTKCHSSRTCSNIKTSQTTSQQSSSQRPDRAKRFLSDSNLNLLTQKNSTQLNDTHINAAQRLIRVDYPWVSGLQDTVLQQDHTYDVIASGSEYVQIFHVNGNHWITASSIGCEANEINIFDSAPGKLSTSTMSLLALYHHSVSSNDLVFNIMDVVRQPNGYDCGVYAIAFVASLLQGQDPTNLTYINPRKHLINCLTIGSISSFPSTHRHRTSAVKRQYTVEIHCTCRGIDDGQQMICCDACDEWYHVKCVLNRRKIPNGEYICGACK